MKNSTVSVIIPAYNEEKYLRNCLDSLLNQTLQPQEIIVIDNNSTDKTVKLAKKYPLVKVVNEKKQGVFYARNTGAEEASGTIIARIDADTQVGSNWIETIQSAFDSKKADALTGPCFYYDMPLSTIGLNIDHVVRKGLSRAMDDYCFLAGNNMAISKEMWNEISSGLCSKSNIHEDLDIAIHVVRAGGKVKYWPDMIAGVSARRMADNVASYHRYMKKFPESLRSHGIDHAKVLPFLAFMYSIHLPLRILHKLYDPKTGLLSIDRLLMKDSAKRVDPMTGKD